MVKVGISASFFHADPARAIFKGMTLQYIEQNMAHWLMQRDVLAFMIPSADGSTRRASSRVTVAAYAREMDALVLMGGSDVCPHTYNQTPLKPEWDGDQVRDEYEIALAGAFIDAGKPVLGICRGLQLLNVMMGGTLWQDLATQVPHALNHRDWSIYADNFHATSLVEGSSLAKLYPGMPLARANSIHHQAIRDLGRNLAVEAWSEPDRIAEAIRWTGPSYVRAVQWHPEFHPPGDRSCIDDTPLLDDFLQHARDAATAASASAPSIPASTTP